MNEQVTNGDKLIGILREIKRGTKRVENIVFIDYLLEDPDVRIPSMLSIMTTLMYADKKTLGVVLKLISMKELRNDKP